MIRWYDKLYMDEKAKEHIVKITDRIERGKPLLGVYCITIASNPNNLFDIYNTNELMFKHYKRMGVDIVGLAYGKESAIQLIEKMVLDVYENSKEFKVREYFAFPKELDCNDRV